MQNQGITILVVDDEAPVRKLLRRCFETEHYTVLEAESSEQMFQQLESHEVDLITLDISLGAENGLDLAKQLRAISEVGIIVVSGKGDLIDTVLGLELGADDYISKPFELREVLARSRSVLRRTRKGGSSHHPQRAKPKPTSETRFGNWVISKRKRKVQTTEGAEIELTTAEFDLLVVLIDNAHNVLSRSQIMDAMKGQDWNPNDRTIDNHIAKLRKKFDVNNEENMIKSVRGVGYVFTLDTINI